MDVEVVPPSINESDADFTVRERKINFGLSAIKACGGGAADAIVAARKEGGPYRDLYDFCERVDPQFCNRATIETLVKAGALDSLGGNRASLMAGIDKAMQAGASALADRKSGQKGLFETDDADDAAPAPLPEVPEFDEKELLSLEKEVLGFYLTSHPLAEYEQTLRSFCTHSSNQCTGLEHRTEVVMGGMIAAVKFSHTKNPKPGAPSKYAMWDLEDLDGVTRCILWPDTFAQYSHLVEPDAILGLRGAIDKRPGAEEVNLIVNELFPISELSSRFTSGVVIHVREGDHGAEGLETLREILRGYPGQKGMKLRLNLADGGSVQLDCQRKIDLNPELRRRVDELLGPGSFRLVSAPPAPKGPTKRNGRERSRS